MYVIFTKILESKVDFLLFLQCPDMEGVVNEDLPNSWECPKCCKEGKNVEYKVIEVVFVIF
jgi:hypothetical protein